MSSSRAQVGNNIESFNSKRCDYESDFEPVKIDFV